MPWCCGPIQTTLPVDLLLTIFINELAKKISSLVLDDYHVIHNERIHAALIKLLARIPAKFHLAITSR